MSCVFFCLVYFVLLICFRVLSQTDESRVTFKTKLILSFTTIVIKSGNTTFFRPRLYIQQLFLSTLLLFNVTRIRSIAGQIFRIQGV